MEVEGNTCEDPKLGVPIIQNAEFSQTRHHTSGESRHARER